MLAESCLGKLVSFFVNFKIRYAFIRLYVGNSQYRKDNKIDVTDWRVLFLAHLEQMLSVKLYSMGFFINVSKVTKESAQSTCLLMTSQDEDNIIFKSYHGNIIY